MISEKNLASIEGRWNLNVLIFDTETDKLVYHMSKPVEFRVSESGEAEWRFLIRNLIIMLFTLTPLFIVRYIIGGRS